MQRTDFGMAPARATPLSARVGGSPKRMLALSPRELERDGLSLRTGHPQVRVGYEFITGGHTVGIPQVEPQSERRRLIPSPARP